MRLLLDTHILLALGRGTIGKLYPKLAKLLDAEDSVLFGSTASVWEMSIKLGIGKLELASTLPEFVDYLADLNVTWLPVTIDHAANPAKPEPYTRDPFDRMLLAQCSIEGMRLVTVDQHLAEHPLAIQ